eukprot:4970771-Prymnesium_polylepis.1
MRKLHVQMHPIMCGADSPIFAGFASENVQGLGVSIQGCTDASTGRRKLNDGDGVVVGLSSAMLVQCAEPSFTSVYSGRVENVCAASAKCLDEAVVEGGATVDAAALTSATCICPAPSYPPGGSSLPVAMQPDVEGCVTVRSVTSTRRAAPSPLTPVAFSLSARALRQHSRLWCEHRYRLRFVDRSGASDLQAEPGRDPRTLWPPHRVRAHRVSEWHRSERSSAFMGRHAAARGQRIPL